MHRILDKSLRDQGSFFVDLIVKPFHPEKDGDKTHPWEEGVAIVTTPIDASVYLSFHKP